MDRNGLESFLCHHDISFALVNLLQRNLPVRTFLSLGNYPEWKPALNSYQSFLKAVFHFSHIVAKRSVFYCAHIN